MSAHRTLILIKHAHVLVDPSKPTNLWQLSAAGRQRADALGDRLKKFDLTQIITSDEPKAIETGKIVAEKLGIATEWAEDLHEHDRSNVPVMPTAQFISSVALFFQKPDELVLGKETAAEALDRFECAIDAVLQRTTGNIGIVTHGTVLSLFAAKVANVRGFELWRRMQLPSYLVLNVPRFELVETVESV